MSYYVDAVMGKIIFTIDAVFSVRHAANLANYRGVSSLIVTNIMKLQKLACAKPELWLESAVNVIHVHGIKRPVLSRTCLTYMSMIYPAMSSEIKQLKDGPSLNVEKELNFTLVFH